MGAQSLIVRSLTLLSGLLVLILSIRAVADSCPGADPAALAWLDKMSRSSNEVNYHGVVTLQRGDTMQVMQVSHSVTNGSASESLTRLTGQGAQVVRVEHPLHCVHPGHSLLRIGTELQEGNCGISTHYRFSVSTGERVAGRKSVRIQIEPRDMYRYGYVMELDRETGLLLKTRTLGVGRKTLERFQFANLSFAPGNPGTPDVEVVHKASHPLPASSNTVVSSSNWKVSWIPGGFMLTDAPASGSSRKTYTDGLAVFSVFLEELPARMRPGEGVVRSGPTTSYTRGMSRSEQPILVTVIGEVPVNTARMVADSIGWTQ
jgi:sigma-E factor negative regulatory protein RseB